MAAPSRFCVFWIRNTIRNVTIVVPVLITSCQVSLKAKRGPVTAQTTITATARKKVSGRPVAWAVHLANRVKRERDLVGLIGAVPQARHYAAFQTFCDPARVRAFVAS